MRFLIVSDLHANWEALQAVLADARGSYDRIVCCGDLVGYGADPDVVTEWVRQNVSEVIRGNHDKACAGLEDLEWFNPLARISAVWTMDQMNPRNVEWLRSLAQGPALIDGFEIAHGSPLDEDEYIVSDQDAAQLRGYIESGTCFFGHTHLQGGFLCHRNGVQRLARPAGDVRAESWQIEPDQVYLLNPGSVGQPRDGDPRAAYALWDSEQRLVTFHRVAYDVPAAQEKILSAGLPDLLAQRLSFGR
ncbi:MAG TPA: metallophosphoesterase family protein [Bryobacteraceae bacterium]|nr:metallophosphoesterase family protein [Bryobacteraceae bacterium]